MGDIKRAKKEKKRRGGVNVWEIEICIYKVHIDEVGKGVGYW